MATFRVKIRCNNDAFVAGKRCNEIARILRDLAKHVENGYTTATMRDINGNVVGSAHLYEK